MLRAFAVASETSDVVGTVDLACTADGLLLHFVRVRPHSPGSAPTPPVRDQRAVVPYEAVRQAWDDGETLRLILDHPEIPYKKLVLAHVTRGGGWDQQQARRWRVRGQQVVVGCAALGLGGWVALMQALAPEWTPFLSVLGAVGVGYGSVQALHAVGRWTQLGGDNSAADRRGFFEELRTHLPPALLNDDAAVLPDSRGLSATEPSTLVAASAAVMSSRISSRWIEENMSMLAAAGAM